MREGFSISDKAFDDSIGLEENLRRLRAAGFTHLHWATKWTKPEPFDPEGRADWEAIAAFIARSRYRKAVQLEVRWFPDRHETHEAFLAAAYAAAARVRRLSEK
jgi:hypothetical protein